jgi:hypothetical protein
MNPARARYLTAISELADAFVEITILNPERTRYLTAIAELANVIVEIPLDDLPPYHRDLQAAINQRNPDVQQALSAHANSEFLDSILDLKGIDEQRFPRGRWQGSEKPGRYWKGCDARRQRVLQRARGEEQDARCRFPNCDCTKPSMISHAVSLPAGSEP